MTTTKSEPSLDGLVPEFVLGLFSHGEQVEIDANLLTKPSIERHASKATLYGLAILQLQANGVLDTVVDALLAEGPMNEVDAANRLSLMTEESYNAIAS